MYNKINPIIIQHYKESTCTSIRKSSVSTTNHTLVKKNLAQNPLRHTELYMYNINEGRATYNSTIIVQGRSDLFHNIMKNIH